MKEKLTNIKNCVKEMIKTVLRPFWKVFKAVVKFLYDKPLLLNVLLSLALAVLLEEAGRQTFPLSAWGFITQKTAMFLYSAFIIFFSYSIVLMNIMVPLIERATKPKPFGKEPEKHEA